MALGARVLTSGNDLDGILYKERIGRDHRKVIHLGSGDNQAVARVAVERRQGRRTKANIQIKGEHLEVVVRQDGRKPVSRWDRQVQFTFLDFDTDFKTADRGDIGDGGGVNALEGHRGQWALTLGHPQQGTGIEDHRLCSGHSSAVSGSVGS